MHIETVGEFPTNEGDTILGVLLVGTREEIKEAAKLFGEDVALKPADNTTKDRER